MTARAAEALELALWLHRAPARRAALLGRPLPDGIGELLRVAPGAPDQVAAAARITGEPAATILEAVRFYLQQILFHEDSDAYRVLGLRPGAPQAQAREHHHLLQQWLHPDRRGPYEWESIYTGRVNRAWTQLRTPQARAAYDASLNEARSHAAPSVRAYSGEFHAPSPTTTTAGRPRSRSKPLALVVLLACAGLVALIAVRNETPPEWRDPRDILVSATEEPLLAVAPNDVSNVAALVATLDMAPEADSLGAAVRVRVATDVEHAPAGEPPLIPGAAPAAISKPTSQQTLVRPASIRTDTSRVVATDHATAAYVPPAIPPPSPARPARLAAPPESRRPTIVAEPVEVEPVEVEPVEVEPVLSTIDVPLVQATTVPDAEARMAQARQSAHEIADYLSDLGLAAPPVWNDLPVLRQAQATRAELHQRNGMPRRLEVELRGMQWRHAADSVHLGSGYRAAAEQGRVEIEFVWRENQWLVSAFSLVPEA